MAPSFYEASFQELIGEMHMLLRALVRSRPDSGRIAYVGIWDLYASGVLVPEVVVEYSPSGATKSVVQNGGTPVAYATNDVGLMEAESCLILSTVQEMLEPVATVLSENLSV
jgi:hypothetical protein